MTIRMGYWDCHACGHKRIDGPLETCPGCGRPRDQGIAFYTDDQAEAVTDPELVRRARMGADWQCKYCRADNRAGHVECHSCGAGPDGTKRREEKFAPVATAPKKKSNGLLILGIVLAVLGSLGAGIWFLFLRTTELAVTVDEVAWVKTAQLEEKKLEKDSAWADEVPDGARELDRETRSRSKTESGTEKVKVGTKDLGNGMFEDVYEERPKTGKAKVDDTWVTYEIERWVKGKKLKEESTDGEEPPEPKAKETKKVRVAKRENKLVLKLDGSDGKSYTHEIDLGEKGSKSKKYKKGDRFTAEVNTLGAVVSLK